MAFTQLQFTKDWNNSTDFPTYEPNEAQVRADIQFLYDEIKDYLNDSFLPELSDTLDDMSDAIDDRLTEEMADDLYLRYLASLAGPIISVREISLLASDGASGTANIYATGDDFAPHVLFKPNLGSGNTVLEYIADPTADNQAANKHYVDDTVSDYLPLTGGHITGNLVLDGKIDFGASSIEETNSSTITLEGDHSGEAVILKGIDTPHDDNDAANKGYVDDAVSDYLPLSGGTMTGDIEMGSNRIKLGGNYVEAEIGNVIGFVGEHAERVRLSNVADPVSDYNAANKKYVDDAIDGYLPLSGGEMDGDIDLGGNDLKFGQSGVALSDVQTNHVKFAGANNADVTIAGVANPEQDNEAANKGYVDDALADYTKTSDLADVATSGSYDDLTNKPTIPDITGLATEQYVDTEISDVQSQIDALVSKSDVVDVVANYAELQAYDTTTLLNNDVVKVLDDSTHSNQRSYYRWVITGGVGAWVYVGSEAVGYTKAETDTLLNGKLGLGGGTMAGAIRMGATAATRYKITMLADPTADNDAANKNYVDDAVSGKQDTISDLATIRSGAALGATALQSVPSGYATETYVTNAIAAAIGDAIGGSY